jgi:hypothetical protein
MAKACFLFTFYVAKFKTSVKNLSKKRTKLLAVKKWATGQHNKNAFKISWHCPFKSQTRRSIEIIFLITQHTTYSTDLNIFTKFETHSAN